MLVKKDDTPTIELETGLFAKTLFDGARGTRDVSMAQGWLQPGATHSSHTHDIEEVVLILSGHGILSIKDETYNVTAGDAIYIPAHTLHSTINIDDKEDLCFVAAFSDSLIGSNPLAPDAQGHRNTVHGQSRTWNRLLWFMRKLKSFIT